MKYITTIKGREFLIDIIDDQHVSVDGEMYEIDFEPVSNQPVYSMLINNASYEAHVYPSDDEWQVVLHGNLFTARVEEERERRLRSALGAGVAETGEYQLRSPMPGLVVTVPVEEGQQVEKGDVLLILESMKMQNELKSPRAGTIGRIRVKEGDSVELKQTLLSVL